MNIPLERPLTKNIGRGSAMVYLEAYENAGGYRAAKRTLLEMQPADVTREVKASNLRGRGGAGFPTGAKWSFVRIGEGARRPKYLVANADEMEPGTFKDRLLMEGDPHQLIEGMIVSAYAIEAERAIIFIRQEYGLAAKRLRAAIDEARTRGYLGRNILGSGFDLEISVHRSAGRYICGEETALLDALEGKRAIPRAKPPFPQVVGLFGQPTIVQNVETLCNVPHIVNEGAAWFQRISRSKDGGTKIYGVSGRVKKPGAWELPMGTRLREILRDHAGDMREGYEARAVIPGGASTAFLPVEEFDSPMDFDSIAAAGSRLGTGMMIVLDDKTCPVGLCENLEHFFAQESCGWCTPCREGLPRIEKILQAIETGRGEREDLDRLDSACDLLGPGLTFCALAPGAIEPLKSALRLFRDDFERHVTERRCPFRAEA